LRNGSESLARAKLMYLEGYAVNSSLKENYLKIDDIL
jgi:hypothetical protein